MKHLTAEEIAAALGVHPWAIDYLEDQQIVRRVSMIEYDQTSRAWVMTSRDAQAAIEQALDEPQFVMNLPALRSLWQLVGSTITKLDIPRARGLRFYENLVCVLNSEMPLVRLTPTGS